MPEHPPPAPDWILGEDGHWKPPPFDSGARRAAPPAAVPPGGPPAGPPTGGTPWPPPNGGQPWGPPPATGSSTGRTVAVVLGVLGVAGVAVVGLLIGAVTFLGTTSEPKFERVGPAPSSADDGFDPTDAPSGGATDASPPAEGAPAVPLSAAAAELVAVELEGGDEWYVAGAEPLDPQQAVGGICAPEGWLTGAVDRFRTYYGRTAAGSDHALTVSITTYADAPSAQAEGERARSETYRACEVEERLAEVTGGATAATATALPDDPLAPGVAYQIDLQGGQDPLTEYEFTIIVGTQRGHLDFCGCADLGLDGQRLIAQAVARKMAEAQGLAAPG